MHVSIPSKIDDTRLFINLWQDKHKHSTYEPSFSRIVDENPPHGPSQEVKHRCSSKDVAIPIPSKFQTNIPPFEHDLDEEEKWAFFTCTSYANLEILDLNHEEHSDEEKVNGVEITTEVQPTVEHVNIFETTHKDF